MDHHRFTDVGRRNPGYLNLVWREPKNDDEAMELLKVAGAIDCKGPQVYGLAVWMASRPTHVVVRWFTAYAIRKAQGKKENEHEYLHAFDFLTTFHPELRILMESLFP